MPLAIISQGSQHENETGSAVDRDAGCTGPPALRALFYHRTECGHASP